jgi:hypothetical protein
MMNTLTLTTVTSRATALTAVAPTVHADPSSRVTPDEP